MSQDNKTELDIIRAGMTAPRITPKQIDDLMLRVQYVSVIPQSTTSTFVHSYLVSKDGKRKFSLATGHSACVSPENYNAEIGMDIAQSKCLQATKDKLWELLGFGLFQELDKESEPAV